MKSTTSLNDPVVSEVLHLGELVVARTDTIYGIIARAKDPTAVKLLYHVRHRDPEQASIVLIASSREIPDFSRKLELYYEGFNLSRPTTIIHRVPDDYLPHLPRQASTLAFRVVNQPKFNKLLKKVGPLIAPSANPSTKDPATNIQEAYRYFGDKVSLYVDGGTTEEEDLPSRIIRYDENEQLIILRD